MTRSRKKADKLTDKEVLQRLFPKEVRKELKKQPDKIQPLFEKKRKRKS